MLTDLQSAILTAIHEPIETKLLKTVGDFQRIIRYGVNN